MAEVGNLYSKTGWYTPTYYRNRTASDWAGGKNTRPDNYSKSELKEHYDFLYNEPISKMRPTEPLPSDADEKCYDWVFNIRSDVGRWQLHNPNGLNADRVGLSPYDWEETTTSSRTRTLNSGVSGQSFDAAFRAAVDAVKTVTAPSAPENVGKASKKAEDTGADAVSALESRLGVENANRNAVLQDAFKSYATTGTHARMTYHTLLNLTEGEDEKKSVAV